MSSSVSAAPSALAVDPDTIVSLEEQRQYKIQLLLHINSVLLAKVIHVTNTAATLDHSNKIVVSQCLKRVHANLQCVSQINQGLIRAKPMIMTALDADPLNSSSNAGTPGGVGTPQQPPHDILSKLYLLMSRVFEFW
ncbi:Snf11p KNAG_0D01890 [Huiozyma naganishii CBS 8797]|uniref:Uncharacterized protein n=1 Tax=Huiozyma naganishii (strain ATCC MYA-139 / BCRC 22969 / CBS 8797 / KCTC 17520 / NBRC 10181 / NCYC 3082 / Yp74L-3) TaxID=1071383 RepID=J7R522_HUIN7|nr:hypothetical protein KNAG_0D01890 [Kazachstania naganishii CBS 8797]CCK69940.1 hypothetical protein KNAG_0D01890 [Kazachstania naganishii CBS 8797]